MENDYFVTQLDEYVGNRSPHSGQLGPMRPTDSDAQVIQASARTPARFAEVFDRHYDAVRGYLGRRLPAELADEAAAETFLIAFRRRADYDPSYASAKPWLMGIATRLVCRHRRDERRRIEAYGRLAAGELLDHTDESIARVDAQEFGPALRSALLDLPTGERDVLMLFALGGLTYGEIAQAMQIPTGTVRSRLSRAREKLGAVLDPNHHREGVRAND